RHVRWVERPPDDVLGARVGEMDDEPRDEGRRLDQRVLRILHFGERLRAERPRGEKERRAEGAHGYFSRRSARMILSFSLVRTGAAEASARVSSLCLSSSSNASSSARASGWV